MKKNRFLQLILIPVIAIISSYTTIAALACDTYKEINTIHPFAVSIGCAMSQTQHSSNTAHPDFMRTQLLKLAKNSTNPRCYLSNKDHIGYFLRALPDVSCAQCCKNIYPAEIDLDQDKKIVTALLDDIIDNIQEDKLTIKTCPYCHAASLIEQPRKPITLTPAHQKAMVEQLNFLGTQKQPACTQFGLPNYRISVEASDILKDNSTEIDPAKLQTQALFLQQLGNPLLFCHHYSNPQTIPNLFEKPEHTEWFADYCAQLIAASPQITHACPISQPVAFSHRVTRGTLPPFTCNLSQSDFLKNITQAQVAACKKMKAVNPNLKVLASHQWKPMKPAHGYLDPRYALELFICKIVSTLYNGNFISMLKPYQNQFDGIALSVYPALYFNLWTPQGNNSDATFNKDDALEAIMKTHQAFPTKDIYIVETGCNTTDPDMKRAFIDTMLHVCKIACDKGVSIKGIYFWSHTNDPEFYSEWNFLPGTTHFSPFDRLNPDNPCASVNAAGLYLKEILQN